MRTLVTVTVLSLFASAALAAAQAPAPKPGSAPPARYELAFSPVPEGVPDPARWPRSQSEGPIAHREVPSSLARGTDLTIAWLAARKVCDPAVQRCAFLARLAFFDEARENPKSRMLIRYAFRGPDGAVAEGLVFMPGRNPAAHRYFRREGTEWVELTDEREQLAEFNFLKHFTELVNVLRDAGLFPSAQ